MSIQTSCRFVRVKTVINFTVAIIAATLPGASSGRDWTQFRGGASHGYSAEGRIPDSWNRNDYLWTAKLPGSGFGSPVVYGDRAFVLCADPAAGQRTVVAISLKTGQILWQSTFPMQSHPIHARNSFASSTPAVDLASVYVAFADPEQVTLIALTHDGEVRWQRDLGTWQSQHGFGASPALHEEMVFLFNSQQAEQLKPGEKPGQSRMMAFDRSTGNTVWETPLTTTRVCYGVPLVRNKPDGTSELIGANTGDGIFALSPTDGKLLWRLPVFSARVVSCPLQVGDLFIATAGAGGGGNHLVAVSPPAPTNSADRSETYPSEAYRIERNAPYVPTPAVANNRVYVVDDRGIASSFEGDSGKPLWTLRLGGNFGASPIVIGTRMLAISLDGTAHVISIAGKKGERISAFELGGEVQATPCLFQSGMLLRIENELCCLSIKN